MSLMRTPLLPIAYGLILACGLLSAPASATAADNADVEKILAEARKENLVMDHLDELSNRIGPRLTSSDALETACEWARDRFKSFGIENARLERWGEFPVGFNRGPWSGRMIEPRVEMLTFGTNSWTAGTKGIVRGKVVRAPADEAGLDKIKADLPGSWVLVPPTMGRGSAAGFREKLETAYREAKIAGMIRGSRNELIVTGGDCRVSWDKLPEIPAINLVKSQFDAIAKLAEEPKPVILEFDIRNHFRKGPIPLHNVIADIVGTEFPDEYVIVGGHIDTWDGATGSTDNGTGCATTLEAARLLMKSDVRPKRTIRFMLWSGEEQGLLGSRAYVKANPDLMKKISAVLVHDGGTNYLSGITATKAMLKDMEAVFAPVIGLDPEMPFAIRETPGLRGGGSDHASFLAAGAPGFFWRQSGKAVYSHTHHTQHDTYDAAIPEYQRHSAVVAALGSLGIANLDHLLSREGMVAPAGSGGGNRRTIGVQLEGLKVTEVIDGGAAAKGGVRAGDEIVKVGGKAVANREEFVAALQSGGPSMKLVVKREGKEVELTLTTAP